MSTNGSTEWNPESMLKGRIAETLFEELMRASGNTIYRFGYEAIMQNLTQLKEKFDRYNGAGVKIRSIPDFIVLDKNRKPIFVEVKFRRNGKAHNPDDTKRLAVIKEMWGADVVIVNCTHRPYFAIARPPYLDVNQELISEPLSKATEFNIDLEKYAEYERLVEKYLSRALIKDENAEMGADMVADKEFQRQSQ